MNQISNRKYYLDNLRLVAILFIFLAHIFNIYSMGDTWYIRGQKSLVLGIINDIFKIWRIPLLFTITGIVSRYSLKKRSAEQYAKNRINQLLAPFIFGMLLIVPIQPYLAGLFHNGHAGYFDSFTKVTNLTGYDGAFTPGNLWFLLYLFVIAMVCLPFMNWYNNKGKGTLGDKVPLIAVVLMGLLPCIVNHDIFKVIAIDDKNILEYFVYFLLGYFFLSNDNLQEKLDKHRFLLLGMAVLYTWFMEFILNGAFRELARWLAVLSILGLGRHYLNFSGKITGYIAKSSFGVYLFHQSWIVVVAFFIFKITDNPVMQIPLILLLSVILTYSTYEICRRTPVIRWMFGLKK